MGLAGGVNRLLVEWRGGGLGEEQVGSVYEWSGRRVLVALMVIALVIGAGFARTGDEPLPVYVGLSLLAGVILLLDRVERYIKPGAIKTTGSDRAPFDDAVWTQPHG